MLQYQIALVTAFNRHCNCDVLLLAVIVYRLNNEKKNNQDTCENDCLCIAEYHTTIFALLTECR